MTVIEHRLRLILFTLLSYLVFEIFCFYGIRWIRNNVFLIYYPIQTDAVAGAFQDSIRLMLDGKTTYLDFDATLGWTVKPHGTSPLYQANADGIRASRDYEVVPPQGKIRLAAFGDSFTHGDDVSNPDTWEEQLAGLDPRFEVLNFGVPAYGLDQAWLRYQHTGRRMNIAAFSRVRALCSSGSASAISSSTMPRDGEHGVFFPRSRSLSWCGPIS